MNGFKARQPVVDRFANEAPLPPHGGMHCYVPSDTGGALGGSSFVGAPPEAEGVPPPAPSSALPPEDTGNYKPVAVPTHTDRVKKAASALEAKLRGEVQEAVGGFQAEVKKQMMLGGGVILAVVVLLLWMTRRKAVPFQ